MAQNDFYVVVNGEKVYVTEEVYRAYVRPVRNEQRNEKRRSRCMIGGKRCLEDCSKCSHFKTGKFLSLDALMEEDGMDFQDENSITEDLIMQKLLINALYKAVGRLPEKERTAVILYSRKATESQIGKKIGMSQQGAGKLLKRVWKKLEKELKDFR
jgi:DNA-directed RNA polymerase specialized sigma24 family protein